MKQLVGKLRFPEINKLLRERSCQTLSEEQEDKPQDGKKYL